MRPPRRCPTAPGQSGRGLVLSVKLTPVDSCSSHTYKEKAPPLLPRCGLRGGPGPRPPGPGPRLPGLLSACGHGHPAGQQAPPSRELGQQCSGSRWGGALGSVEQPCRTKSCQALRPGTVETGNKDTSGSPRTGLSGEPGEVGKAGAEAEQAGQAPGVSAWPRSSGGQDRVYMEPGRTGIVWESPSHCRGP